jgi:hypothetical protein
MRIVEFAFQRIYETNVTEQIETVVGSLCNLYNEYKTQVTKELSKIIRVRSDRSIIRPDRIRVIKSVGSDRIETYKKINKILLIRPDPIH